MERRQHTLVMEAAQVTQLSIWLQHWLSLMWPPCRNHQAQLPSSQGRPYSLGIQFPRGLASRGNEENLCLESQTAWGSQDREQTWIIVLSFSDPSWLIVHCNYCVCSGEGQGHNYGHACTCMQVHIKVRDWYWLYSFIFWDDWLAWLVSQLQRSSSHHVLQCWITRTSLCLALCTDGEDPH